MFIPSEVEAVVGSFAAVKDVAVIGLPDNKWGERVHAVVVLHDGAAAAEADIIEFCQGSACRLQAPALGLLHLRAGHAAHRDRQDPAPPPEGAPRRQVTADTSPTTRA